jgi:hypothetical protein
VPLTVGNKRYEVRFNPATEPVNTVARNFCISQSANLGIAATEEGIADCVTPVGEFILTDARRQLEQMQKQQSQQQQQPQKTAAPTAPPATNLLTVAFAFIKFKIYIIKYLHVFDRCH